MRTLVIHPKDSTTDFLSAIYVGRDWTIVRDNPSNSGLRKMIKEHDRIIMLGHGTEYGLIGYKRFLIHSNHVMLLREKVCVAIWCHADKFMRKYELSGFHTGMFISELDEAYYENVFDVTFGEIELSNKVFAGAVGKYIDSPNMLNEVKAVYRNDDSAVVVYNHDRLNFNIIN